MVNYVCENCDYTTTLKTDFTRHLSKKNPCVKKSQPVVVAPKIVIANSSNPVAAQSNTDMDFVKNEIMMMKFEIERLKNENVTLKAEVEKLKADNMVRSHFDSSFNQLKFFIKDELSDVKNDLLSFKFQQVQHQQTVYQPPPHIIQIPQAPAPVQQVVQPVEPPSKPVAKKIKAENLMNTEFQNAVTIDDFIENMTLNSNSPNYIINAKGKDPSVKFVNGITSLFLERLKELPKDQQPMFCSNASRKRLNFKQNKYKMEKTVVGRYTKKEALKEDFSEELIATWEQDADGKYIRTRMERLVSPTETEWKNYDSQTNYDDLAYHMEELRRKVSVIYSEYWNKTRKTNTLGEDDMENLNLMNSSVKDNIQKIASQLCNSLYVETSDEDE